MGDMVMKKICTKIFTIPMRILCILLVMLQMGILDVYLATYMSMKWLAWIAADVIVVFLFIFALVLSYLHIHKERISRLPPSSGIEQAEKLPFSYIAWGFYTIVFVGKVYICFTYFAYKLQEKDYWGPNILKIMLALSAPIFLLFLLSHFSTRKEIDRKRFIDSLTSSVTFDIFDTVAILDILFVAESRILLSFSMQKAILAIGLINLCLPLVPLVVLSRTYFGKKQLREQIVDIYHILLMIIVNIPYLTIRIILWNVYNRNISIFLMKNFIAIFVTIHEICQKKHQVMIDEIDTKCEEIALENGS